MTVTAVTSGQINSGTVLNAGDEIDVYFSGHVVSAMAGLDSAIIVFDGGVTLQDDIELLGAEVISAGGSAYQTSIGYGGAEEVASGGQALGNQVNAAGTVYVDDGGIELAGTYTAGGDIVLSAGASSFSDLIGDAGVEIVYTGATAFKVTVAAGGVELLSGGYDFQNNISGGSENVHSGGKTASAVVMAGGSLNLLSAGLSTDATLQSGGFENVSAGGRSFQDTVGAGGVQTAFAGGKITSATIANFGQQAVSSGGIETFNLIQSGGVAIISDHGGGGYDTVSGGALIVAANGVELSATVEAGGLVDVLGVTSATDVQNHGTEQVEAGGETLGTMLDTSGTQIILGGIASGTQMLALGDNLFISGGVALDTALGDAGQVTVYAGGTARRSTLLGGLIGIARQTISAGGVAVDTNVLGGIEDVFGSSVSAGVAAGGLSLDLSGNQILGTQNVFAGGTTTGTIVQTHGLQSVRSGGIASGTVILGDIISGSATALQVVSSGGFALATIVSSGGVESVQGNASGTTADVGRISVVNGGQTFAAVVGNGGSETIDLGGFASGTVLNSGGTAVVHGTTSGTIVNQGGEEDVLSGGVASSTQNNWIQLVSDGGIAVLTTVNTSAAQTVISGGIASGAILDGGAQLVAQGGITVSTSISAGSTEDVLSGGTAKLTTISSGGLLELSSGGVAGGGMISSGGMVTASAGATGGVFDVLDGGTLEIQSGAGMSFNYVAQGGVELVGGTDYSSQVDGGLLAVTSSGAVASRTSLIDGGVLAAQYGGVASATTVSGPGGSTIDEYGGGVGSSSLILSGGNDVIHFSGLAIDASVQGGREVVHSGGVAMHSTITSGGRQFVESGGTATNTVVGFGGGQVVSAGGIVNGTQVDSGGLEVVSSGGIVEGGINVANGGTLQVAGGAVFQGALAGVTLDAGAQLLVSGPDTLQLSDIPLSNGGGIVLDSAAGTAVLRIAGTVSLLGSGAIEMEDSYGNRAPGLIEGFSNLDTLDNVGNTIFGYGMLGGGLLHLINETNGTIDASLASLTIDTGHDIVSNAGLLEGFGGNLVLASAVSNSGIILANNGGTVTLKSAVVGLSSQYGIVRAAAGGIIVFDGGTLSGTGIVTAAAQSVISVMSTGSIDASQQNVSLAGSVQINYGATLSLTGHVINSGTILLDSTYHAAVLLLRGGVQLSGAGTVMLQDSFGNHNIGFIEGFSNNGTLDNIDNTISGYGSLGGGMVLINEGSGVINGTGGALVVDSGTNDIQNIGLMEAVGGTLDVASVIDNTGIILADAGGTVRLRTAVNDASGQGGGVVVVRAGGTLVLDGASITGAGGVASVALGVVSVISTGTLDGRYQEVLLAGTTTIDGNAALSVAGTISNSGSIVLNSDSGTAALLVQHDVHLTGGGSVILQDPYTNYASGLIGGVSNGITLDNVDNTISGYGLLGAGVMVLINEAAGTIDATASTPVDIAKRNVVASKATLAVNTGANVIVNKGLMEGVGGALLVASAVSNTGFILAGAAGTVTLKGSVVDASGASGGVVGALAGGTLVLNGGSLTGTGVVATAANSVLSVISAGLIDGSHQSVALLGNTTINANATLSVAGTIGNSGSIVLNSDNGTAALLVQSSLRLTGGGKVVLTDAYGNSAPGEITGSSALGTLDNVDNTISGFGALGGGSLGLANEAAGTVDATASTLTIDTGANVIVNKGLLEGVGGALVVASAVSNTGTIGAGAGGTVTLKGPITGSGAIAVGGNGVSIAGAVASGQTISFAPGQADTLDLAHADTMLGTLSGFTSGDTIRIDGLAANVAYTAGATPSSGSLVLSVGGTVIGTLAITGNYAGQTFLASPNTVSGTDIILVTATIAAPSSGALTVTVQPGTTVSLDTILANPTYAALGPVSTLVVSGGGTVVATKSVAIADVEVTAGTLILNGQTITTDPVTVAAGSGISGNGIITGGVTDNGTITAQGGRLELTDAITGTGVLSVSAGSTLQLDGSVTSGLSVGFQAGGDGALQIGTHVPGGASIANFQAVITSIGTGDTLLVETQAAAQFVLSGSTVSVVDSGSNTIEGVLSFATAGLAATAFNGPNILADQVACFASGTLIGTQHGDVAVEALRIGDLVRTASGALRPVRWIGRREIDLLRHPDPHTVRPISVSAGAFGRRTPSRDLFLSPEHAVFADGVLIPVGDLVNGTSIAQTAPEAVTYWHVELDQHDVMLAEGLPVESYLDTGNRAEFCDSGVWAMAAFATSPCAPVRRQGAVLETLRRRIDQRHRHRQRSDAA